MGNSGPNKPKRFPPQSGGFYEFEVYISSQPDQAIHNFHNLSNNWCIFQFIYKELSIVVSKDGIDLETIALDNGFEVSMEQPEDLIFTIKFCSDNDLARKWKIRCKSQEEYIKMVKFLKKSIRHDWKSDSKCQVNFI